MVVIMTGPHFGQTREQFLDWARDFSVLQNAWTGSRAHAASYSRVKWTGCERPCTSI